MLRQMHCIRQLNTGHLIPTACCLHLGINIIVVRYSPHHHAQFSCSFCSPLPANPLSAHLCPAAIVGARFHLAHMHNQTTKTKKVAFRRMVRRQPGLLSLRLTDEIVEKVDFFVEEMGLGVDQVAKIFSSHPQASQQNCTLLCHTAVMLLLARTVCRTVFVLQCVSLFFLVLVQQKADLCPCLCVIFCAFSYVGVAERRGFKGLSYVQKYVAHSPPTDETKMLPIPLTSSSRIRVVLGFILWYNRPNALVCALRRACRLQGQKKTGCVLCIQLFNYSTPQCTTYLSALLAVSGYDWTELFGVFFTLTCV